MSGFLIYTEVPHLLYFFVCSRFYDRVINVLLVIKQHKRKTLEKAATVSSHRYLKKVFKCICASPSAAVCILCTSLECKLN